MFGTVLFWVGVVIGGLLSFYAVWVVVMVSLYVYYAHKIWNNFPLMSWLTLEEAKRNHGVPYWACRELLPYFFKRNYLEIRPKANLSPVQAQRAQRMRFNKFTINLYEFRLTVGPTRKKKSLFAFKDFIKLFPGFEPPALPA